MTHRTETGTTDTHRPQGHRILSTLVVATLLLAASAADAALTTGKCLVLKRQAWGNLRKCQATEEGKQIKGKPADLSKCQAKFQEKLTKITAKATAAAIACRYRDNGDRTVTDYDTGLQWEKKTASTFAGICVPLGDLHCVDDKYDWDGAHAFVDATADGATFTSCFFGHCGWRLPMILELQTILSAPCVTSTCIDPIFGPTAAAHYWSSTTYAAGAQDFALAVNFAPNGNQGSDFKATSNYVRAVRGAL